MFFFCEDRLFAVKTVFSHNVESCFTCQHGNIWNGLFVMFVYVDNNRPRQPSSRKTTVSTNLAFLKKMASSLNYNGCGKRWLSAAVMLPFINTPEKKGQGPEPMGKYSSPWPHQPSYWSVGHPLHVGNPILVSPFWIDHSNSNTTVYLISNPNHCW